MHLSRMPVMILASCCLLPCWGGTTQSTEESKGVPTETPIKKDCYGDLLPDGAIARLGTVRFRPGPLTRMVVYSPDGKVVASTNMRAGVRLWDVSSGRLLHEFHDPRYVWSLAFSADGKALFVSGDIGGDPTMLDAVTGKVLRRFKSGTGNHSRLALSPDGLQVAANAGDQVLIWEAATGKKLHHLKRQAGDVGALSFSPDGRILVSGTEDGTVFLWDTVGGTELRRLKDHEGAIWAVAFSPDGKLFASAGEDGTILVRDMPGTKVRRALRGGKRPLNALTFSPDGTVLASGGTDAMVRLWDPRTGKEVRQWRANAMPVTSVTFAPDGKRLATAGAWDHAIRFWDPATSKEVQQVVGHTGVVQKVQFTADGKALFSWGRDRNILTWDLATSKERRRLFVEPAVTSYAPAVALSPEGRILATTEASWFGEKEDGTIRLWDTTTGKELPRLHKHRDLVRGLGFSPDGKWLASGGDDGVTCLWDVATGKELQTLAVSPEKVQSLAFSPNGKLLAWGYTTGTIRLYDTAIMKEVRRWKVAPEAVSGLVFSPDAKLLASSGKWVSIWDVTTGKEVWQLGKGVFRNALAFSSSGRHLATIYTEGEELNGAEPLRWVVDVWELASGQKVRRFVDGAHWFWCLAFAPGDHILATGTGDSSILLWDLTGRMKDGQIQPSRPTRGQLERLWTILGTEAPKANDAKWLLVAASEEAIPFLHARLRPAAPADATRIDRLIGDLDNNRFDVRQRVTRELKQLGELAAPQLRKARDGQATLELRQRIDQLLKNLDGPIADPERLRVLRAVDVLEQIATPAARGLLRSLAAGAPEARLTLEARVSLERLTRRTPPAR